MAGNHACFDRAHYLEIQQASFLNQIRFHIEEQPPFMTGDRVYNVETKRYGIILMHKDDCYLIDYDGGIWSEQTKKTTVLIKVR